MTFSVTLGTKLNLLAFSVFSRATCVVQYAAEHRVDNCVLYLETLGKAAAAASAGLVLSGRVGNSPV